jgi:hypothetical protein
MKIRLLSRLLATTIALGALSADSLGQTPFSLTLTSLVNGSTVAEKTFTPVFNPATPSYATAPSAFTESGGLGSGGIGTGAYANWVGWEDQSRYFYYSITAAADHDLSITEINSSLRSSPTGPRAVAVETSNSLDGTWTQRAVSNLTGTGDTAVNATGLSLTVRAGTTLYIRYRNTSAVSANGSTVAATGTHRINSGSIVGTYSPASATAPVIASFNPTSGEIGSTVVITGVNLGPSPAVRFNGIAASSLVNAEGTEITATVPSGATTGPITVEVAGQPVATSPGNFTVVDPLAPTLSTSGTLTAFNTIVGTPSASQSFTVSAANITGNVTVTAPTGFEVSADDSTFGPTASLSPLGGVLTDAPVYVRIAGSAVVGPVSGNVSVAATGATTQNVAASGTVGGLPSYVTLVNTNANSYTQNFDSLGTTTISNVVSLTVGVQTSLGSAVANTLDGWYAAKINGSGGIANIMADSGGGSSGAVYNYGSTNEPANTDRSLGGLASGSFTPGFGALIKNETGQTLQGVQISFISKLWRSSTVTNALTFGYGLVDGATFTTANFLTAAGATSLVSANVAYPAAASNVAVDGNLPANQIAFNNVTIPQEIAPGETLFIRWQDFDGAGSDAGIAIDNVSLTALADAPPATAPFVAPTSAPANELTRTQAGVVSSVTGDGGSAITARGFVYAVASVNPSPTIGGTGTTDLPNETAEVGPMTQTITGLTAGTTYAVRSYASNAVGTTYSSATTFTTLPPPLSFTGNYSESFSTYTGTLPAGWTVTSSSNAVSYQGEWGTGSTGGFRGVGETTGPVLGYQHTGSTGILTVSVTFVNDTQSSIETLDVSYLGRTALPANTRTPAWVVTVAGTLTPTLDYSTGNTDGEAGAPADLALASQVSGLSIAPGAEFTVTWVSERGEGGGSSRQIGIADFAISSGGTPPNPYNSWASGFGLDPDVTTGPNAGAPTADPDGDGFNNQQEFAFGTNPTLGSPSLLSTTASGGNLIVRWLERAGVTYNPQSTANLATTAFGPDAEISVVAGPADPAPPAGYTRKQFTVPATGNKFYRVTATTSP